MLRFAVIPATGVIIETAKDMTSPFASRDRRWLACPNCAGLLVASLAGPWQECCSTCGRCLVYLGEVGTDPREIARAALSVRSHPSASPPRSGVLSAVRSIPTS